MAGMIYQLFTSSSLFLLGLYHLIFSIRDFIKSPRSYSAKPFHPFPSAAAARLNVKHLPLYLLLLCLLLAFAHQCFISADPDPLLKGRTPVHRFTSLQSAALLFLFLILSTALLLSDSTSLLPLPPDLFFALASTLFYLQFAASAAAAAVQTSDLQAKCDALSGRISALCSLMCLILACRPKLFMAEAGLAAGICLQGLWELQTGLSLYVEAFIPEGCHQLLDVVSGVEGSTKCDVEEARLRAVAILDLVFVVHVTFVVIIVMVAYAVVAKSVGARKNGSYEALPTAAGDHIQMKALSGTQA